MAILAHKWLLDEASGTTCVDSGAGNVPATIISVSGSPARVLNDGPAVRFNGANGGANRYVYEDHPRITSNAVITCDVYDPFSISAWINLNGSSRPKIIVNTASNLRMSAGRFAYGPPEWFLYVGTNGRVNFGAELRVLNTSYREIAPGTTILAGTSGWHHVLGRYHGTIGQNRPGQYDIFVDGKLEGSHTPIWNRQLVVQTVPWVVIGHGQAYWTQTTVHWPHTWYSGEETNSNGSFQGDIRDVRFYCGELTDEEIWEIYSPNKTSTLAAIEAPDFAVFDGLVIPRGYKGVCIYPTSDAPICAPRSTSRSCPTNSTTPVIVRKSILVPQED